MDKFGCASAIKARFIALGLHKFSENRIFTDADDYSMEIELPLADCPQNLDIFGMITRKDVDTGDIFFRGAPLLLRKRPEGRWLSESIKGGRDSLRASLCAPAGRNKFNERH